MISLGTVSFHSKEIWRPTLSLSGLPLAPADLFCVDCELNLANTRTGDESRFGTGRLGGRGGGGGLMTGAEAALCAGTVHCTVFSVGTAG